MNEITKPKSYRNSPVIGDGGVNVLPGDCSKQAKLLLELYNWGEVDKTDVPEMERRFKQYIDYCIANDIKIGNQAAYLAIGIDKDDVYRWGHGLTRTIAHRDFIKKVQKICATFREGLMQDGKINPITGIFWQKNYDGMKDTQDIVVTPNNPLGEIKDVTEIAEKYAEALPPTTIKENEDA